MQGSISPNGTSTTSAVWNAVYPITIDPLATSPNWTAESNQAEAKAGYSVGAAGDVNGDGYADLVVGAPNYDSDQENKVTGDLVLYKHSASGDKEYLTNWGKGGAEMEIRWGPLPAAKYYVRVYAAEGYPSSELYTLVVRY